MTYRKADKVLENINPHTKERKEHIEWEQQSRLAQTFIGLSLYDGILGDICNCKTARKMLSNISSIFRRRRLLNKMRPGLDSATVEIKSEERMLSYVNRVQELGSILKSMVVEIDDQEVDIAGLYGLPPSSGSIATTLDALSGDIETFTQDIENNLERRKSNLSSKNILLNCLTD